MELPKALSGRRTFLSAVFHLLSRLPAAPLLRQLGLVGAPQVPQPLCGEGVAAQLDGLQVPLDGRRDSTSSQALVQRREAGDARLAQHALRSGLRLPSEEILEEPGQKQRHELAPPTKRGEKGLLELATLQGPRHPTLRLGGQRLMEKAFLPHPPSGLVANILCLSLGVIGLELISFLLLLMDIQLTGRPSCGLQLSTLVTVSSIQPAQPGFPSLPAWRRPSPPLVCQLRSSASLVNTSKKPAAARHTTSMSLSRRHA